MNSIYQPYITVRSAPASLPKPEQKPQRAFELADMLEDAKAVRHRSGKVLGKPPSLTRPKSQPQGQPKSRGPNMKLYEMVKEHGPITYSELSKRIGLAKSTIQTHMAILSIKGLVKSQQRNGDETLHSAQTERGTK